MQSHKHSHSLQLATDTELVHHYIQEPIAHNSGYGLLLHSIGVFFVVVVLFF